MIVGGVFDDPKEWRGVLTRQAIASIEEFAKNIAAKDGDLSAVMGGREASYWLPVIFRLVFGFVSVEGESIAYSEDPKTYAIEKIASTIAKKTGIPAFVIRESVKMAIRYPAAAAIIASVSATVVVTHDIAEFLDTDAGENVVDSTYDYWAGSTNVPVYGW